MKNLKVSLAVFYFTISMGFSSIAQTYLFKGKVSAFEGIPLERIEVKVKKSKTSVFTDEEGVFIIECQATDKLRITGAGFKKKTITATDLYNGKELQLLVSKRKKGIEIASNSGHLANKNRIRALQQSRTETPYGFGYTNMVELVKAKFPNLTITNSEIILRGTKSMTGGTGALIGLNGVAYSWNSLKTLNVLEIEDLRLLTGVQATRYGPGSGNGVLEITLLSK